VPEALPAAFGEDRELRIGSIEIAGDLPRDRCAGRPEHQVFADGKVGKDLATFG